MASKFSTGPTAISAISTALPSECAQGRDLGFDGKTLIHPSQIEACNAIFTPPAEEVAEARKIIAAFERPENASRGAIQLDGRMVERLHADMAQAHHRDCGRDRGDGTLSFPSPAGERCFDYASSKPLRRPRMQAAGNRASGCRGLLAKYAAR